MKYVKLALISFILLFGIATLISLLLPSKVIVSRAIDIKGSRDSIYGRISNLSEWRNWLANKDTLPVTLANKGTLIMGDTKVTLTAVSPTQVKTGWQVKKGKKTEGTFNLINYDTSPLITVQWQFVQQLNWYPWEKFASIVSDKVLSPFMEESLDNLKMIIEKNQ